MDFIALVVKCHQVLAFAIFNLLFVFMAKKFMTTNVKVLSWAIGLYVVFDIFW